MNVSKISVLTGTRADYGLLRILMKTINDHPAFQLDTIVTGTHFSPEFGNTWEEIINDGLPITYRAEILSDEDSPLAVAQSAAKAMSLIAEILDKSRPDLLIILGDRFEAHAAAEAAFLLGIPIAHIAGGEKTEGALDDGLRHSITKFASMHFVAADEYRKRVIQLGENPESVHNVGAIGLDNFSSLERLSIKELSDFIGLNLTDTQFILCTLHPETANPKEISEFLKPLSEAIGAIEDFNVVITHSNADAGGKTLNELLSGIEAIFPDRVKVVPSLGQRAYISALEYASVVLGNSSSGILEGPSAGTPTINIGTRQLGRLRAPSVIDIENTSTDIIQAVSTATSPDFQAISVTKLSPFGAPGASKRIVQIIASTDLGKLLPKHFFDLDSGEK